MAIAKLTYPLEELRGVLQKSDDVYVRMMHGKCVVQRKPKMKSKKRIAACKAFGRKYGTARKAHVSP